MHDRTIKAIASKPPRDMQEFNSIKGVGPVTAEKYGKAILCLINNIPSVRKSDASKGTVRVRHPAGPQGMCKKPRVVAKQPQVKKANVRVEHYKPINQLCMPSVQGGDDDQVYILELAKGRVYVGKTHNVDKRVAQHTSGVGAAFTKVFPPTGNLLDRLGKVRGCGDAAERDETIRYMLLRGINNVRGWRYTQLNLSKDEVEDAELNIRELFNLCRRCGNGGHFITQCRCVYDRSGRKI